MELKEFKDFLEDARANFREILEEKNDRNMIKKLLKKQLDKCCSSFEEECLKENLREVFSDYMENLRIGA